MTVYKCECGFGVFVHGVRTDDEHVCDDCGKEMWMDK